MAESVERKEFASFLKEAGLIWGPEPGIYGGLAGFYTYGPLGKLLKNKVENSVRRLFNAQDFREVEGPTVVPDTVWKASGHLDTFEDRVILDESGAAFRADKVVEEAMGVSADHFSNKELLDKIKELKLKSENKKAFVPEINSQSLMMKTNVMGTEASLRPETATVTYLPFPEYYSFFRKKSPFAVFQIGKAYRNEISPRQSVLRGREFTQAEGQVFVDPLLKNNWEKFEEMRSVKLPFWSAKLQKEGELPVMLAADKALSDKLVESQAYVWCLWLAYTQFLNFGIPPERIRLRQHHDDEKAFYASDAWDIEVKLQSVGWTEVCGVHDRGDYDLSQHAAASGVNLSAKREDGSEFTPHVLEIAFGTDRPVYALIDLFYDKKEEDDGKTMFKIPYHMSPVEVAVFPLQKKPELTTLAKKVKASLEDDFIVEYDQAGSIGRRYLRSAKQGVPFALTVDFDSVEKNDITVRDRDSEKQIRIPIHELPALLRSLLKGEKAFSEIM